MIFVITTMETDPRTGRQIEIVSHGIDSETDQVVTLQQDVPQAVGAIKHHGEWVIRKPVEVARSVPHPQYPFARYDRLDVLCSTAAQAKKSELEAVEKGWSIWMRSITPEDKHTFVAYKRSEPSMPHDFHDREDGLAHCKVCGGAEGSLPWDCPGKEMPAETQEVVYVGLIDYVNGYWIPGRTQMVAAKEARERAGKRKF